MQNSFTPLVRKKYKDFYEKEKALGNNNKRVICTCYVRPDIGLAQYIQ